MEAEGVPGQRPTCMFKFPAKIEKGDSPAGVKWEVGRGKAGGGGKAGQTTDPHQSRTFLEDVGLPMYEYFVMPQVVSN